MAEAVPKQGPARWVTNAALLLAVGGLVAALVAAVGSGQGAWDFGTGFTILRYAFFAAIAGGIAAIVGLILARRAHLPRLTRLNLVALAASLVFGLYLGNQIRIATSVPPIHDITTSLQDPPTFTRLKMRADNLENVPDLDRPELARLAPEARWKAVHAEAYGDLRTVHLPWQPAEAIRRAEQVARTCGWDIALADPARGILEATDTTFFFRFKDDVVVRARPDPIKGGSRLDVRSVSRVGGSDVGVNAKRIRSFISDLQKS